MKTIKLADWCDKTGVKYLTAWRWFKADKMPVRAYQTDSGTILVEDDDQIIPEVKTEENETNKAISLFLKKTIEYSSANYSIDEFAAYILSNFQLKLIGQDQPQYSRNKPKSEEVQKHFKKFIPNVEKPAPCTFIPEPDVWENLTENFVGTNELEVSAQGLVNEIRENDEGALVTKSLDNVSESINGVQDLQSLLSSDVNLTGTTFATLNYAADSVVTGGGITYSDLNPHNYTYSTNTTSSNLLNSNLATENSVFLNFYNALNKSGQGLVEKPKRGRPRKKNND